MTQEEINNGTAQQLRRLAASLTRQINVEHENNVRNLVLMKMLFAEMAQLDPGLKPRLRDKLDHWLLLSDDPVMGKAVKQAHEVIAG